MHGVNEYDIIEIQGSEELLYKNPLPNTNSPSSLKPLSLVLEKESHQLAQQLYRLLVISSCYITLEAGSK